MSTTQPIDPLQTVPPVHQPAVPTVATEDGQESDPSAFDSQLIEQTKLKGGRVLAVGTTAVRALESAYQHNQVLSGKGETDILIYPGYHFQVVDQLLTNFHTPESTLLLLVAAFSGKEQILEAYRKAVAAGYRFFSYGDAMLIQ